MTAKNSDIPWASFCIATYRRPSFLRATLHSLIQQTLPDFEVIVSDNDPQGSSRTIIEEIDDRRVRYSCNSENVGMVKNFNRALAQARGEYVVMVSDDDPIYPEMLDTLSALSGAYPGYGAYYGACDVRAIDADLAKFYGLAVGNNPALASAVPLRVVRVFSAEDFPSAYFSHQIFPYVLWSTGIVKRQIALEIGGFPDYGSAFLTDFTYLALAGSHSGCATINTPLGCQTVHEANFGRKEFAELETALRGSYAYVTARMSQRDDWYVIQPQFEKFLGGWMVGHLLFLRRYFKFHHLNGHELNASLRPLFEPPYMRSFYWKYLLLAYTPIVFKGLQRVKQLLIGRVRATPPAVKPTGEQV
jgi:glycosyltransferase involved in cell wall biosynthesis